MRSRPIRTSKLSTSTRSSGRTRSPSILRGTAGPSNSRLTMHDVFARIGSGRENRHMEPIELSPVHTWLSGEGSLTAKHTEIDVRRHPRDTIFFRWSHFKSSQNAESLCPPLRPTTYATAFTTEVMTIVSFVPRRITEDSQPTRDLRYRPPGPKRHPLRTPKPETSSRATMRLATRILM